MGAFFNKGKNVVVNGALDHWQRGISFPAIGNATYFADLFQYYKLGTMVHTIAQDTTDVPTIAQSGFAFPSSMKVTLTTPQASLAANNFAFIDHKVEGNFASSLYGKNFVVSFWVKAATPGIYGVAFRNGAQTRNYTKSYVVNQANVWEKKVISIKHDLTGDWNVSNGIGIWMTFVLAAGTGLFTAQDATWSDGNLIATAGISNGVNTGTGEFKFAGIMIHEGHEPSVFERAGGDFATEIDLCLRYYEFNYVESRCPSAVAASGGYQNMSVFWKVYKRATPAVSLRSINGTLGQVTYNSSDLAGSAAVGPSGISSILNQSGTIWAAGAPVRYNYYADAEL